MAELDWLGEREVTCDPRYDVPGLSNVANDSGSSVGAFTSTPRPCEMSSQTSAPDPIGIFAVCLTRYFMI